MGETRTSPDVTAAQVRDMVQSAGRKFWALHSCSICRVPVGYLFDGESVDFKSSCGCSWSPNQPRSWQDVADAVNLQSREDVFQRMLSELSAAESPHG
jgi:hypothetical protein